MERPRLLSLVYFSTTEGYHHYIYNLLLILREREDFLLDLIKIFLSSPLTMNSLRYLEMANQIQLQVYNKLLKKSGDNQKYDDDPLIDYQVSGFIQLILRNYSQADLLFQKSLEISRNNIHSQFLQSSSARLNFNFTKAETLLQNLLKNEPNNAIFWDRLGLISLDRHHYSKAEEYFTKSWEKKYSDYNTIKLVGQRARSVEKREEMNHSHNNSLISKIWIKIEFRQFEEAQNLIEIAKENDPKDPYIYNSLGDLKRYQQDSLGSINAYSTAIKISQYEPLFWKNLALIHMQTGDFKQAQDAIDELMNLDSDKIDPWITYAWLYEEKNEFENAILKIKEGLERIPNCAELYIEKFTKSQRSFTAKC